MNKYLVTYKIEGMLCEPHIEYVNKIFDTMDMDDCYDIQIVRLRLLKTPTEEDIRNGNDLPECEFWGSWHDMKDPLKMIITDVKTREVYDTGYGTDH